MPAHGRGLRPRRAAGPGRAGPAAAIPAGPATARRALRSACPACGAAGRCRYDATRPRGPILISHLDRSARPFTFPGPTRQDHQLRPGRPIAHQVVKRRLQSYGLHSRGPEIVQRANTATRPTPTGSLRLRPTTDLYQRPRAIVPPGVRIEEIVVPHRSPSVAGFGLPGLAGTDHWPKPRASTWANGQDRKSTRLNSSHTVISYAVFCLK